MIMLDPELREKVLDAFPAPICKADIVQLAWMSLRPFVIYLALVVCASCSRPESSSKTFQVASSSMAPAFCGPCLQLPCNHCRNGLLVAAEGFRDTLPVRCPSCGGVCDGQGTETVGQSVHVVPLAAGKPPQRFEAIAFLAASDAEASGVAQEPEGRLNLKRIWGLPGENLAFHDGDLWVDGRLYQKGLDEFERVAIPVAKLTNGSTSLGDRRKPQEPNDLESWRFPVRLDNAFSIAELPGKHNPPQLNWSYQRPARVNIEQVEATAWLSNSPLLDDYPLNQGISRSLHKVDDFLIKFRWHQPIEDSFILQLSNGRNQVQLTVHGLSRQETVRGTKDTQASALRWVEVVQQLDVACCDGRWLVRSDVEQWVCDLDEVATVAESDWFFLRMAPQNDIAVCEVSRDIYLYSASGSEEDAAWSVPENSSFVLGDNLPVSLDSRNGLGFVPRSSIVGGVAPGDAFAR